MASEVEYSHLAKVVFHGRWGCGKSFLHSRITTGKLPDFDAVGVEYGAKIYNIDTDFLLQPAVGCAPIRTASERQEEGGSKIKVQYWDQSGSQRFRSVTRSFFKGMQVLVFCVGLPEWCENADLSRTPGVAHPKHEAEVLGFLTEAIDLAGETDFEIILAVLARKATSPLPAWADCNRQERRDKGISIEELCAERISQCTRKLLSDYRETFPHNHRVRYHGHVVVDAVEALNISTLENLIANVAFAHQSGGDISLLPSSQRTAAADGNLLRQPGGLRLPPADQSIEQRKPERKSKPKCAT